MCYAAAMAEVGSRELRNNTRSLLERVERGEQITITVNGRPVALLQPIRAARPTWMPREQFLAGLANWQADPALTEELKELAPDTTDDLPL